MKPLKIVEKHLANRFVGSNELTLAIAGVGLILPIAFLSLGESIFVFLHQSLFALSSSGPRFLAIAPILISTALLSLSLCITLISNRQGVLLSLAGATIAFFAEHEFRGVYTWPGTFHLDDRSQVTLVLVFISSLLLALLTVYFLKRKESIFDFVFPKTFIVIGLSVCLSWANHAGLNPTYSDFPIARHWALTTLTVVSIGALIASKYSNLEIAS